jgi:hypothetical protein
MNTVRYERLHAESWDRGRGIKMMFSSGDDRSPLPVVNNVEISKHYFRNMIRHVEMELFLIFALGVRRRFQCHCVCYCVSSLTCSNPLLPSLFCHSIYCSLPFACSYDFNPSDRGPLMECMTQVTQGIARYTRYIQLGAPVLSEGREGNPHAFLFSKPRTHTRTADVHCRRSQPSIFLQTSPRVFPRTRC